MELDARSSLGAIRALISTGRLSRVDNVELRLELAGIHDVFSDVIEEELFARQITMEQLAPLLGEAVRLDYTSGDQFFGAGGKGIEASARGEVLPAHIWGCLVPDRPADQKCGCLAHRLVDLSRSELVPLRGRFHRLIQLISQGLGA